MKTHFAVAAVFAAIFLGSLAHAQTGFPLLPSIPKTPSLKDDPKATKFRFIAAGDNRPKNADTKQPDVLSWIFKDAQQFKPVFFLWAGDIIYGHEWHRQKLEEQYTEFLGFARLARAPVFNAPGNHEMDRMQPMPNEIIETPDPKLQAVYLEALKYPKGAPAYGAFDYGNSRFIALNTEEVGAPSEPTPT